MTFAKHNIRRHTAGLSILELLVALALLGLIAAGLAGALSLSIRIMDRTSEEVSATDPLYLRAQLRGWLRNVVPSARSSITFSGTSEQLVFEIPPHMWVGESQAPVSVSVKATAGKTTLNITDAESAEPKPYVYELANTELVLSYYDARSQSWSDTWTKTDRHPALVRITSRDPDIAWPLFSARTPD